MVDYEARVRTVFPDTANAVLKAYPAKTDTDVFRALADLQRDASVGRQMAGWARAQRQSGSAPVYGWLFTRRQPYASGITFGDHDPATVGAYHSGDVPYWFQSLNALNLFRTTRNWEAEDQALATTMSDMIVSFAKTGVPSADWPAFDPKRPRLMRLGTDKGIIDWPNYKLLDSLKATPPAAAPSASKPAPRVRD